MSQNIPLHVCFINSCRVWGGGEKWHFEAATGLPTSAFQVTTITGKGTPLHRRLQTAGITTLAFAIGNLSFLNPFLLIRLWWFFRSSSIDTLILNLPADLKAAGIAARLAGVRRIVYRRGSAIPVRNTWFNRLLFRRVIDDIIANSGETARTLVANNPDLFPSARIRIIYNGLDTGAFDREAGPPVERTSGSLVLGNAGRLNRQKGQKQLLEIFRRLQDQGSDCYLRVAGDGELGEELQEQCRQLGVEDQVRFEGFVSNMAAFMQEIDVFCLTSRWEGFGYVLIEAMAAGKPVVAWDLSSNPEIVEHGRSGYLVEPDDQNAFVSRLQELGADPQLRATMGQAGRERVEQLFSRHHSQAMLQSFLMGR